MQRRATTPGYIALAALALTSHALAVDQQALDDWGRLLQDERARGIQDAVRLANEAKDAGDAHTMLSVLASVTGIATYGGRSSVLDEIGETLAELAKARGDWEALCAAYVARVNAARALPGDWDPTVAVGHMRAQHFLGLAREASARAGSHPASLAQTERDVEAFGARTQEAWDELQRRTASRLPQDDVEALRRIWDAIVNGGNAEAVERMDARLSVLEGLQDPQRRAYLWSELAWLLWVRGADRLLWRMAAALDALPPEVARHDTCTRGLAFSCVAGWGGDQDAYLAAMRWLWGWLEPGSPELRDLLTFFADKANRLCLYAEADALAEAALRARPDSFYAVGAVNPGTPPALRRRLLAAALRNLQRQDADWDWNLPGIATAYPTKAPPGDTEAWALEAAFEFREASDGFREAKARAAVLDQAATLFDQANRPDLAAQCRDLAASIAANDPKTLLQCALTSARSLATEGKWDELAKALGPAVANQPPSTEVLQAALLLHEANLRLSQPADADTWLAKAWDLVNTLPLPPAEKANYLLTMAGLCDVAAENSARVAGGQP